MDLVGDLFFRVMSHLSQIQFVKILDLECQKGKEFFFFKELATPNFNQICVEWAKREGKLISEFAHVLFK